MQLQTTSKSGNVRGENSSETFQVITPLSTQWQYFFFDLDQSRQCTGERRRWRHSKVLGLGVRLQLPRSDMSATAWFDRSWKWNFCLDLRSFWTETAVGGVRQDDKDVEVRWNGDWRDPPDKGIQDGVRPALIIDVYLWRSVIDMSRVWFVKIILICIMGLSQIQKYCVEG